MGWVSCILGAFQIQHILRGFTDRSADRVSVVLQRLFIIGCHPEGLGSELYPLMAGASSRDCRRTDTSTHSHPVGVYCKGARSTQATDQSNTTLYFQGTTGGRRLERPGALEAAPPLPSSRPSSHHTYKQRPTGLGLDQRRRRATDGPSMQQQNHHSSSNF